MRLRGSIAALSLAGNLMVGVLGASEAFGQYGAVVVIPGKPGVPVIMNGQDISWAVVEGDWGLARPGQVQPTVIYRYGPPTPIGPADSGYYPATGRKPRVGRLEIIPPANRRLPTPAEDFHRSWGVTSDMTVPA